MNGIQVPFDSGSDVRFNSEYEKIKGEYETMLIGGYTPENISSIIEESFINHLIDPQFVDTIFSDKFNYDEEEKRFGVIMMYKALIDACNELKIDISKNKKIKNYATR